MSKTRKKKKPSVAPPVDGSGNKPPSTRQARREPASERNRARRQEWLLVGVVLLVTAFAFFNSLNGEFVYDDRLQIVRNPTITQMANIPKMFVQSVWQFLNQTAQAAAG